MALNDGMFAHSPTDGLKAAKRPTPIRPTPTLEQFRAIVDEIRSQRFNAAADESADFVEFLGLAGLGQAEVSALTWGDIDWENERIVTFRHKTSAGFAIPLYPQLRPLLERRKATRSNSGPDEPVFGIKEARKAITKACERLNLPHYSSRSFRRMFITRAIEKGVDVKVIAEWQGHKDGGKLILQTYSHVNPVHSQRIPQLMVDEEPDNVIAMATATV
jgi:integrase